MVVEDKEISIKEISVEKTDISSASEQTKNQIKFLTKNSRFDKLNNKEFINPKTWEKVVCKYERISKKMQKLFLENDKWKEVAKMSFIYNNGLYYIIRILSFKKWNGGFLLDIYLNEIWNKWVYLIDDAKDLETWEFLNNFYSKKWFTKFWIHELDCEDFLYKWNVSNSNISKIKLENIWNQ